VAIVLWIFIGINLIFWCIYNFTAKKQFVSHVHIRFTAWFASHCVVTNGLKIKLSSEHRMVGCSFIQTFIQLKDCSE